MDNHLFDLKHVIQLLSKDREQNCKQDFNDQ